MKKIKRCCVCVELQEVRNIMMTCCVCVINKMEYSIAVALLNLILQNSKM